MTKGREVIHKKKVMKLEVLRKHYGYLIVGDKYYKLDMMGRETIFKEVKASQVKKKIKLMEELSKKLKDSLDAEAVMMEALSKLEMEELIMIHDKIFNEKRKTKPRTRKHHCVDMKVGDVIIPIVD